MSGISPSILGIEGFAVETGRPLQDWDEEHSRFVAFIRPDERYKPRMLFVPILERAPSLDREAFNAEYAWANPRHGDPPRRLPSLSARHLLVGLRPRQPA